MGAPADIGLDSICISSRFLSDAQEAGLGATLKELLYMCAITSKLKGVSSEGEAKSDTAFLVLWTLLWQ